MAGRGRGGERSEQQYENLKQIAKQCAHKNPNTAKNALALPHGVEQSVNCSNHDRNRKQPEMRPRGSYDRASFSCSRHETPEPLLHLRPEQKRSAADTLERIWRSGGA